MGNEKEQTEQVREGYVKKGGVNPPPATSRPAPPKGEGPKQPTKK